MQLKQIFFFLLFCSFGKLFSQKDSITYVTHFSNGKIKNIWYWHGVDTTEYIKYYKNGQVKDSTWFRYKGEEEIPFRTSKSYYKDGKLENITRYGANRYEFTSISYWPDGSVSEQQLSPGVRKCYTKKGKVKKQMNLNRNRFVYVPKKHKKDKAWESKKQILLVKQKKKIKIKNNVLISLTLANDTSVIELCKMEGFVENSIFISKFSYNRLYNDTTEETILKYDSTFVVRPDQLKTIYYSKHYNGKRNTGAIAAKIIGIELMIGTLVTTAVVVREPSLGLPIFGSTLASGLLLMQYSKYLYKTMVPKRYDLNEWQIQLKN